MSNGHAAPLEAIVIATPLHLHAEISVTALEAGLHVLCEKMMARDVEGLRQMLEASRRTGRHWKTWRGILPPWSGSTRAGP